MGARDRKHQSCRPLILHTHDLLDHRTTCLRILLAQSRLTSKHLKLTLRQNLRRRIRLLRLEDSLRGSWHVGSAAAWLAAIGSQADVHRVTKAHGLRTTLRQEGEQILLALGICQQLQPLPIHQDSLNFAGVICQSHCGQDGYFFLPDRLASRCTGTHPPTSLEDGIACTPQQITPMPLPHPPAVSTRPLPAGSDKIGHTTIAVFIFLAVTVAHAHQSK